MELIEMYVEAVGRRLHPSRRENVEAELRASILDALESRGASPDDEEDVIAVLSGLGEPERLADEYQPNRRYLIGPELFPLFRRVARVVLVTLILASMLGFGVLLLLGGLAGFRAGALLIDTLGFAVWATFVALVILVAAFAWLQRAEVRLRRSVRPGATKWDPRSLPARHAAERSPRFEALAWLVAAAAVLVILGGIGQVAREVAPRLSADVRPLVLDGVIANVMLLQVALVISVFAHGIALVQASWRSYTHGMRLLAHLIGVVVFVRLPFQLIEHRSPLLEAGLTRNLVNWLVANALITAAVMAGIVVAYWWRAWRRRGGGTAGRSSPVASVAATALLAASLPACAVAPRATNTTIEAQSLTYAPGPDSLLWEIHGVPAGELPASRVPLGPVRRDSGCVGLHSARLRGAGDTPLPGRLPAARRERGCQSVVDRGPRERDPRQYVRGGSGRADDRRHAARVRFPGRRVAGGRNAQPDHRSVRRDAAARGGTARGGAAAGRS